MENNFQRLGSRSNANVGSEFECNVRSFFVDQHLELTPRFKIDIGVSDQKKPHEFDLGSELPKVLVECKSHTWTKGANVPSAKITTWDQAMYYFSMSPRNFRKMFCVLRDERSTTGETLAAYYIRLRYHLIPDAVEIWEFSPDSYSAKRLI